MSAQRYFMNWTSKTIHKLDERRSTKHATWAECRLSIADPVIKAGSVEALCAKAPTAKLCAACFTGGSRGGAREGRDR